MSEPEGTTPVLERTQPSTASTHLTIDVKRHDEPGHKGLRFTVQNFDITDQQYLYNIRHVLGLERIVDSVAVYNGSGDVYVTLQHWQLITEDVAVKLAKSIGNALGFAYGHIDINVGRLE